MPGHVDILNNFEIRGWAVKDGEKIGDTVSISIDGEEVARIAARVYRQDLEEAIGIGRCAFGFSFDETPGVFKPIKISVRSASSGALLANGERDLPPLLSDVHLRHAFGERLCSATPILVTPVHNGIAVRARVLAPAGSELGVLPLSSDQPAVSDVTVTKISSTEFITTSIVSFTLARDYRPAAKIGTVRICDLTVGRKGTWGRRLEDLTSSMCVPRSLDWLSLPPEENFIRTSGRIDVAEFAIGGVSAAHRIYLIARPLLGKDIRRILDWGVGCGRVAVPLKRVFLEDAEILGVDVDQVNVDWCKHNFSDVTVEMGDFYPPLDIESGSIDLIYGISVMTHLSRDAQASWLRELRRILRLGGLCILTTEGEYALSLSAWCPTALYRDLFRVGISDMMFDDSLGPSLAIPGYYRRTYQLRRQVEEEWARYLNIVSYLPAGSHAQQDMIVMIKD